MRYSGWVPTVTGNLSFTTIGCGSFPTKSLRRDTENGYAVYQRRDLLDVLVPYADDAQVAAFFREHIANWVLGISGKFSFVLLAETAESSDACSGKILMISDAVSPGVGKLIRAQFTDSIADTSRRQIEEVCSSGILFTAKFRLERRGHVEIETDDAATKEYADSASLDHLLANQAFYFLKDIAHVHQHHEPKHDAITEVHRVEADDTQWIYSTEHDLYRAIIRYKRFRNEKALFRASGILAYAKSFERCYSKQTDSPRSYNAKDLEQSLQVSREEIKHFDQKRLSRIETFRNFFFALFGLIASASFLARYEENFSPEVNTSILWLAEYSAANPFFVAAITFLISFIWSLLTHRIDPSDNELVRWATRLLQAFRLRYYIIANALISIVFGAACWYILVILL